MCLNGAARAAEMHPAEVEIAAAIMQRTEEPIHHTNNRMAQPQRGQQDSSHNTNELTKDKGSSGQFTHSGRSNKAYQQI